MTRTLSNLRTNHAESRGSHDSRLIARITRRGDAPCATPDASGTRTCVHDPRRRLARTLCKMRFSRALLSVFVAAAFAMPAGCASPPAGAGLPPTDPRAAQARGASSGARATSTSGEMPEGAPREELTWATLSPETFARAKAENKYIVLDGSAEWCHWCHVMEATTYHDADVRKILDKHFIAVKVDVDSRPDVEERYGDYGWPATVMFAPDATEIGKYRGYINPEKFKGILADIVASGLAKKKGDEKPKPVVKARGVQTALSEEHLLWIQREIDVQLEDYYDEDQGSWGRQQKAPLGWNNAWTLEKAKKGDEQAKQKALFTLDKQSALLDPVWGGIYQYSAARDWDSPHFEKLMTFQAPALDNYATAYRLSGDAKQLARAKAMLGYLDRFMKSPEGGFYTTQDADLNAHDRGKTFMDGHDYYKLDEKGRLAHGLPRVDTHEYGKENGLAISAYCTMFEVTKDPAVLATAEKATRRVLATHATKRGGITHDVMDPEKETKLLYLSDNATFGLGLVRIHEASGAKSDEYLKRARAIADFMIAELTDDDSGGMFASTKDPDAVGIFATRRVPFEDNVVAVRFLAHLAHAVPAADAKKYSIALDRLLRAVSKPEEIKARGRMIGDYLLALEESKGVRGVAK
jgi:uncharacterized protein YyaL (SSP411 family)